MRIQNVLFDKKNMGIIFMRALPRNLFASAGLGASQSLSQREKYGMPFEARTARIFQHRQEKLFPNVPNKIITGAYPVTSDTM